MLKMIPAALDKHAQLKMSSRGVKCAAKQTKHTYKASDGCVANFTCAYTARFGQCNDSQHLCSSRIRANLSHGRTCIRPHAVDHVQRDSVFSRKCSLRQSVCVNICEVTNTGLILGKYRFCMQSDFASILSPYNHAVPWPAVRTSKLQNTACVALSVPAAELGAQVHKGGVAGAWSWWHAFVSILYVSSNANVSNMCPYARARMLLLMWCGLRCDHILAWHACRR